MSDDGRTTVSREEYTIEVSSTADFTGETQFLIPAAGREATLARLLQLNQQSRKGTEHYRMVVRIVMVSGWEVV